MFPKLLEFLVLSGLQVVQNFLHQQYHWDHWGWERGARIGPESNCMVAPLGPEYVRSTYMDHVCARASGISRIGRLVFSGIVIRQQAEGCNIRAFVCNVLLTIISMDTYKARSSNLTPRMEETLHHLHPPMLLTFLWHIGSPRRERC